MVRCLFPSPLRRGKPGRSAFFAGMPSVPVSSSVSSFFRDLPLLDVDLPAGKFAGQLSVVAPATQDQGYLVGLDHDHGTAFRRIQQNLLDARRLQRVGDESFG